jgi:hypothetical protein
MGISINETAAEVGILFFETLAHPPALPPPPSPSLQRRLQAATRPPITLQKPQRKSLGANLKIIFLWDNRHFGSIKENSECPPYLQYLGINNKPENSQNSFGGVSNMCVCVCFFLLVIRLFDWPITTPKQREKKRRKKSLTLWTLSE